MSPGSGGDGQVVSKRIIVLDVFERVVIASIYGAFVWRMPADFSGSVDLGIILILLSEALPLIFVIFRPGPSITLSQRPTDWLIGISATILPLLVSPAVESGASDRVASVGHALMLYGLIIQVGAKAVLGRAFGIIAANRGVCRIGPYRLVRHPMYAGYTLTHIGFLLAAPSLLNTVLYILALTLQIIRIGREERILMQDPTYKTYAHSVRYRLLPGVY